LQQTEWNWSKDKSCSEGKRTKKIGFLFLVTLFAGRASTKNSDILLF
jgi:hypothetical protein